MLTRIRPLFVKTLRLSAYLTVVGVVLGGVGVRSAIAKSEKTALAMGEPLEEVAQATGGTTLTVNGMPLHLASAQLDAPFVAVLDRAQKGCETHADGLADDLGDMEASFKREPNERGFPGLAILRDVREDRGVVVCFAAGEKVGTFAAMARFKRFAESRDLADVGGLRYVAAHKDESGKTRVTATWADGPMPLEQLFPDEGDAPGEDPSVAPRPAGQRVLSARVLPAPYGAYLYATGAGRDAALAGYHAEIVGKGFQPVDLGAQASPNGRAYRKGLVDVIVTAAERSEGTTLSIVESQFASVQASQGTH